MNVSNNCPRSLQSRRRSSTSAPSSALAKPVSVTWSLGVFTRRFNRLACHAGISSTRKILRNSVGYSRTVVRLTPKGPDFAYVDQPGCLSRRHCQQPGQNVQLLDACKVLDIPLDKRFEVIARPGPASTLRSPLYSLRKAPSDREIGQARPLSLKLRHLDVGLKDPVKESRLAMSDLHLAQGMKANHGHSPGEGIGQTGDEESIRRTRQQKTAGTTIHVNRPLDGQEQRRIIKRKMAAAARSRPSIRRG